MSEYRYREVHSLLFIKNITPFIRTTRPQHWASHLARQILQSKIELTSSKLYSTTTTPYNTPVIFLHIASHKILSNWWIDVNLPLRFRHAAMRPLVGRKGRNNSRRNLMQRSSKSRLTLLNGMHDISKKNDRLSLPPIDVTPGKTAIPLLLWSLRLPN